MNVSSTSYKSIYQLMQSFRAASGRNDTLSDEFNYLETPASLYFRLFFHFNTGSGLLNQNNTEFVDHEPLSMNARSHKNTAANYLYINGELQRLEMLNDFVELLSNINSKSPWYFQSIEGMDEALARPEYIGEFTIEEEPKSITIKCLEDAYDNRIATLLDLYKSICFSKNLHKEILPANLRRFDMTLYIINTPIANVHYNHKGTSEFADFNSPSFRTLANPSMDPNIYSSVKIIEFQGCEIDANSANSGYAEVSSSEPFQMKHSIKITFRNIVEQRYNEMLNRIIGDYIFTDLDRDEQNDTGNVWKQSSDQQSITNDLMGSTNPLKNLNIINQISELINKKPNTASSVLNPVYSSATESKTMNMIDHLIDKYRPGQLITDAASGVVNTASNYVESKVKRLVLGNLYYGSLTNLEVNPNISKYSSMLTQNVLDKTIGKTEDYLKGAVKRDIKGATGWLRRSSVGKNLKDMR